MAVTHIVPRAAAAITSSTARTPRAGRRDDAPRDGEDAIPQLGRDIRTDGDDEDDAILTRRPTRRDGARDGVRPLGLADPPVPIASINADALDARKERECAAEGKRVCARAATTSLSLSLSSV